MAFFLKLKLNYLSKMHGYPKFSFWIPRVLTKGAYHLSELTGRFCSFVNGTRQFWELSELVLAKLALLKE